MESPLTPGGGKADPREYNDPRGREGTCTWTLIGGKGDSESTPTSEGGKEDLESAPTLGKGKGDIETTWTLGRGGGGKSRENVDPGRRKG